MLKTKEKRKGKTLVSLHFQMHRKLQSRLFFIICVHFVS